LSEFTTKYAHCTGKFATCTGKFVSKLLTSPRTLVNLIKAPSKLTNKLFHSTNGLGKYDKQTIEFNKQITESAKCTIEFEKQITKFAKSTVGFEKYTSAFRYFDFAQYAQQ
jgi:hypothetical protein